MPGGGVFFLGNIPHRGANFPRKYSPGGENFLGNLGNIPPQGGHFPGGEDFVVHRHLIPALIPEHITGLHARLPHSFLGMNACVSSCLNVALFHTLCVSLMSFAYLLNYFPRAFLQPVTGRRPVDWCRNQMSAPYIHIKNNQSGWVYKYYLS